MLEELLKHNKIGNKEELLFFLFNGCKQLESNYISDVRKFCASNIFSISQSFEGILNLFHFISFIKIDNSNIIFEASIFNQTSFDKETYLEKFHFYNQLFDSLKKAGVLNRIFNKDNVKFNPDFDKYYILDNKFPYKYFSIRNMLSSTNFFERDRLYQNQLFVNAKFTEDFRQSIIKNLKEKGNKKNAISLNQLKKIISKKETVGKEAEVFVLEYETKRLKDHPDIDSIGIISDSYSNAGYDIESFNEKTSIMHDRFIEVKSYNGNVSFYWSRNEVEVAKQLKGKYFLYLADRTRISKNEYKPLIFQNPYRKIFESELWREETENWKITLKK